ncbi:MAG: glycosyltransferase family 2 protein [Candidatus Bathyarchaeota archaeon]|nr:glycosyltransferase family 2 protein [Candidatus Bathyarchaeota archaeon]
MNLAPICLFTYNRLEETQQCINSLKQNFLAPKSQLIIFSDGGKAGSDAKVKKVREFLKTVDGFRNVKIIESKNNKGLANSIIDGISQIISDNGKVIVLEDDLITSPNFLNFMNQSLDFFQQNGNIQSINGYSLPINSSDADIYLQTRPFSWGWATWEDRWNKEIFDKSKLRNEIELEPKLMSEFGRLCGQDAPKMFKDSIYGRNNSWYIRWAYAHFRNQKYSIYPSNSLVENIGFNSNGTHCKGIGAYNFKMKSSTKLEFYLKSFNYPKEKITKEFLYYFSLKRKLEVRFNALKSPLGRKLLFKEFKERLSAL